MSTIFLKGQKYTYQVSRKAISSITLKLKSRRCFMMSVPLFTPQFMINNFLHEHTDWLVNNSSKLTPQKTLRRTKQLQILDNSYQLIITKTLRDSVVIFHDEHKIYANTTSLSNSYLKKLFDTKFRPLSLSLITQEISDLSTKHSFTVGKISVKNTTSRFGSCSSTNNLNFNWQIIFLPRPIFIHILLHELTHTIHHNHSYKFWDQLSQFDPDWHSHRQYLRTHASLHFLI
ncbi:MAG: YgjP-like metallopeptidase domain-containing protein [Microgenomates group bacterium]